MNKFTHQIHKLIESIKTYFKGGSTPDVPSIFKKKQIINLVISIIILIFLIIILFMFLSFSGKKEEIKSGKIIEDDNKLIKLATDATKSEVKWQSFLEDSIEEEGRQRKEQVDFLKNALDISKNEQEEKTRSEFNEIKTRLSYALKEIKRLEIEQENLANSTNRSSNDEDDIVMPAEISINNIPLDTQIKQPISSYNHIPATSYVSGHLLGGISVSTSVNSISEPIPVIIRLTDKGSLPDNFAVDIKQCRILASCYGDISSERAIIRAEELICEDKKSSLITSTGVSGVIYGDDGANGIRGQVVSMSDRHLKNAFIGGLLSGIAGNANGKDSLNITSFGLVSTKAKNVGDIAKEGALSGVSSAADKLASYHIKLAENISPVILIPGGTKVDIIFTKSVEIGSVDVVDKINRERNTE